MNRSRAAALAAFAFVTLAPAAVSTIALSTPATAATTVTAATPGRYVGTYFRFQDCHAAGTAGVQNGQWTGFVCQIQTSTKEPYWKLYVTP